MGKITAKVEAIAGKARAALSAKDAAREKALRSSRDAVRYCSEAIRSVHRGEYSEAGERLSSVREILNRMNEELEEHQDLLNSGFVYSAQKEYVEGCATLSLITESTVPEPEELGVGYAAYLNGLAEAVGELRRQILDLIRKGDTARCEELLEAMDDIYGVLVTMDFPDAMTGGLRRTTDATRGILERTRGDLTVAARQWELEGKLKKFEEKLKQ
ncbi:MAG TPA: haloacid dehalogenase [Dehalococcoidia bacterium]|nr:haloacid dehalogenase [Dehalococcoidia bacterium]